MTLDENKTISPPGWTLQEALERTSNPALWDSWKAATTRLEKAGALNQPEHLVAQQGAAADLDKLKSRLCELISTGLLYEIGSRGKRAHPSTGLSRAAWNRVMIHDVDQSILQESGSSKTLIYDVRIFPLIHAEGGLEQLLGLSMGEVFQKCVLHDPELVSASKRIRDREKYNCVFEKGQLPGFGDVDRWPLELTTSDLDDGLRPREMGLYQTEPKLAPEVYHACDIMIDRWHRLRRRLVDGDISFQGTFAATGSLQHIDRMQWDRRGVLVDVKSGDFVEGPNVRWSGLSVFHVKPLKYDAARSNSPELHEVKKSIRRVDTTARTVSECRRWLVSEMKVSPKKKIDTKDGWFNTAREKWPTLSRRVFDRVWLEAVESTGAFVWSASGAPMKPR